MSSTTDPSLKTHGVLVRSVDPWPVALGPDVHSVSIGRNPMIHGKDALGIILQGGDPIQATLVRVGHLWRVFHHGETIGTVFRDIEQGTRVEFPPLGGVGDRHARRELPWRVSSLLPGAYAVSIGGLSLRLDLDGDPEIALRERKAMEGPPPRRHRRMKITPAEFLQAELPSRDHRLRLTPIPGTITRISDRLRTVRASAEVATFLVFELGGIRERIRVKPGERGRLFSLPLEFEALAPDHIRILGEGRGPRGKTLVPGERILGFSIGVEHILRSEYRPGGSGPVWGHNIRKVYSGQFREVLLKESMSGGAGAFHAAVNVYFPSDTGAISLIGNFQDLPPEAARLSQATLSVDHRENKITKITRKWGPPASREALGEIDRLEALDLSLPIDWHLKT